MKLVAMIVGFLALVAFALATPIAEVEAQAAALKRETQQNVARTTGLPHPLGVMNFVGTIGGYEVNFNGSIEEAVAHVRFLHPELNLNATIAAGLGDRSDLIARNKVQPPLCCPVAGQNWGEVDTLYIQIGINYLQGHQGACNVGPRSCVRISCSWNSAIFLCNDNYYGIAPNCGYLASYAQDLINVCGKKAHDIGVSIVCGQEFDTDNYNVIVRPDNC